MNRAQWVPESGRTGLGIPGETGVSARKDATFSGGVLHICTLMRHSQEVFSIYVIE